MYDSYTADLIRQTPELEGLDRARLPEFFSDVYTQVAGLRLQLREGSLVDEEEIQKVISILRRLSSTNEALVVSVEELEHRSSAAFVAASSCQLLANISRSSGDDEEPTSLGMQGISSDVAAMLLFLISEAPADAREMAKAMDYSDENPILCSLMLSLQDLAMGRLTDIRDRGIPGVSGVESTFLSETATHALYRQLSEGVYILARNLLSIDNILLDNEPTILFKKVKKLSVGDSYPLISESNEAAVCFSGPYHLASLLILVAEYLPKQAVTKIPPPLNTDAAGWNNRLELIAEQRPYLWKNHTHAIAKGYLETGTSSVIGFPTGAGKSTLSELKISSVLLLERKVVFLAPTHALVDQTTRSLRKSFPTSKVQGERVDELGMLSGFQDLPEIMVMTPEACLTMIGIDPEVFEEVGLLVFDECHLLHPSDNTEDKRAVDSMLCLLNLSNLLPDLDFLLLSAMMKNTDEIAEWLTELTSRKCLSLDLSWKPTRQLRGTLVYTEEQVDVLNQGLYEAKLIRATKAPSSADKRQLNMTPYGMFSLKQTWATTNIIDYRLSLLLGEEVNLAANKQWRLTPNAGEVSASLTVAASKSGLKSLVFFATITNANSAVNKVTSSLGSPQIPLSSEELELLKIAEVELGSSEHLYLNVIGGVLQDAAAVHHGLLLPEERQLCESLYKRPDGIKILMATSTLAQGMNLPSELVIIAEDSQFNQETKKRQLLQARELLNAAGRAGRAGENAAGIVLVIPGKVIPFNVKSGSIGGHWSSLKEIFGQSDQCLTIDDPLTAVLDRAHSSDPISDLDEYVLRRLASPERESEESLSALASNVTRSFSGFRARKANKEDWIDQRITAALGRHEALEEDESTPANLMFVVTKLGLPLELVKRLAEALPEDLLELATLEDWNNWFFDWMAKNPEMIRFIFRSQALEELFGKPYKDAEGAEEKTSIIIPSLRLASELWMRGQPFSEIEKAFNTNPSKLKTCVKARRFALRLVPTLSYIYGVPALLHRDVSGEGEEKPLPPIVVHLSQCIRQGFNKIEIMALRQIIANEKMSRRQLHQKFDVIKVVLADTDAMETWENTLTRVSAAIESVDSRS